MTPSSADLMRGSDRPDVDEELVEQTRSGEPTRKG